MARHQLDQSAVIPNLGIEQVQAFLGGEFLGLFQQSLQPRSGYDPRPDPVLPYLDASLKFLKRSTL